jgi:hypothetical protein
MKKILLSLMLIGAFAFGKAQVLNEIMSIPSNCNTGGGGAEFFEIYGTSSVNVNLDCYALVTYYRNKVGSGPSATIDQGFYVIDFPVTNITPDPITGKWWYVLSSQTNFCTGSGDNFTANGGSWNAIGVTQYSWNSTTSSYDVTHPTSVTDLFFENNNVPSANGGFTHDAMLFSYVAGGSATLVNGVFSGVSNAPTIFPLVNLMGTGNPPNLSAALTCGGTPYPITFGNLGANSVEYVTANEGSGNGLYRKNDGVCGTWAKAASPGNHTPGTVTSGGTSSETYTITQTAAIACPIPKTNDYQATIKFNYTSGSPYPIEYYIIKDDGDGILEPSGGGTDIYYGPTVVNAVDAPGDIITITFPNSDGGDVYFIRAKSILGCFFATQRFDLPACIPLPVHFSSFNATRSTSSNVSVTWTTASEQNSKGFNVQKNVGGVWTTVAFVPSQALNGTSVSDIHYSYTDANSEKGVTQYRVQQVDLDGKFTYTDIRAIRGEGTVGKVIVYPNPSVDGKVNVVFEDNAVRDVQVSDMQGKVIKSYKGITNNILVVERLTSGFYTIKITNRNTAASSVEKVVVK